MGEAELEKLVQDALKTLGGSQENGDDLLSLGIVARVEADAFPGQPVDGTVVTVSTEAEFTPRNIQTRTDRDRLVYPIEVRVVNSGTRIRLRPGMPVQVTLLEGEGR